MDSLQDVLTLLATVVEYFFFAYLAVALMVYSLKSPSTAPQPRVAPVVAASYQPSWERSVDSASSLAVVAS